MPKIYLLCLCLAYVSIIGSCKQKHSKDNFQNVEKSLAKIESDTLQVIDSLNAKALPKTFSHNDEFTSGSYKIIITTNYLNDTLADEYAWVGVDWPIVKSQEIKFMYRDSLYTNFIFPTKKILKQTRKGKSVTSAEIIIWNANLIKTQKADLFGIREASALCIGASCPTYHAVFDLNGKPVYQVYNYGRENHTLIIGKEATQNGLRYKELVQGLDSIEKINGISKEMMNTSYKSERRIGIR